MTKEQAIKVLIVDDHGLMREGLAAMLRGNEQFEVVGLLSSGEDAVNQVSGIMPQVILMDILLRGMTGIEATRWIKDQHPEIKIILISMEMNKDNISLGIKSGIDGFLPKDAKVEELTGAIFSVMRGERYFSSEVRALVFEDFYLKQSVGKGLPSARSKDLSKREEEVLIHLAHGKSMKQVAEDLFISVKTVETHRQHILEKLQLENSAQLVKYAIEHGLIEIKRSSK